MNNLYSDESVSLDRDGSNFRLSVEGNVIEGSFFEVYTEACVMSNPALDEVLVTLRSTEDLNS